MKKFLIYFTGTIGTLLVIAYLAFLFWLPQAIDLNTYLPEIQKLAKEQANIDLNIENPKISTNPLLQAGIKTGKITAKLPDGSTVLETDGIKFRISLPNLLLLTVKVSCAEIKSPKINLEIIDGEQFKVVRLVEDILNKKKDEPAVESQPLPIDPSMIKIKVPNAKISDYKIFVNDLKSGHTLTLKGNELKAGYNNGKTAKVKTYAEILSDDKTNIKVDININTFIPPAKEKDTDDDPAEKIEIPFVNPVLVYRDYDLQSDIYARIKARQNKNGKIIIDGCTNIDNTTVNLSGLQLPKSYFKVKFNGDSADIDTNIVVAKDQAIKLSGNVNYGKNPKLHINLFTDRIFFNDMIILAKAYLDTAHIKNNLSYLKAQGYWAARTQINTDFKKLKSKGSIIAREGNITNGATHLVFDRINANVIFEDNVMKIVDTHTFVNGNILKAEGTINTDSYSDINIHSEKLPLPGLFLAFAPSDLKRSISLTSGALSVDAKVQGILKQAICYANVILENLSLRNDSIVINDEKLAAGVVTDLNKIDGNITNKNFKLTLPQTNSIIQNPSLSVKLDEHDINLLPSDILVNSSSKIQLKGIVNDYSSSPVLKFTADGFLSAIDLRQFAGEAAEPFIAAVGNLPVKALVSGTDKKQSVVLQVKSDSSNYITPVDIQQMSGQQSILQAKIDYKGDKINIKKTGFYTGVSEFTDNLESNLSRAKTIAEVKGTIVNLNTQPFINLVKVDIPNELNAKFTAFQRSAFKLGGNLIVFGKAESPSMRGNFKITNLSIPEILTTMNEANLNLSGKNIVLDIQRLLLNGSDLNIALHTDINPHPVFTISRLDLRSRLINVDKLLEVPERLSKYTAPSNGESTSDIPVMIRTGIVNIRELQSGAIKAVNTTGRISLNNNNFFLQNLNTSTFDGTVGGNITVNLISMLIDIKTSGRGLNVEKALLGLANVKDALTGTLGFTTDIKISGTTPEEMMKNLKGQVKFNIANGQLGPFGKLENMILAENIRESQFFQTALGGVINNLTTIDTSHFKTMDGLITFDNGIAHIVPITTVGNVMSLHISGDFDLLKNTADMKVRAKLGSVIANLLGPLSQLNPINLVQATPGLNVVLAKTFFLFCETLTPEETAELPHLETPLDDKMATKFQIVLRGDVAKPLTLVKSFKWLALASEIEQAENFVSSLPDPSIVEDPENATLENILKAEEEQAKEDAKLKNKLIRFFKKNEEI